MDNHRIWHILKYYQLENIRLKTQAEVSALILQNVDINYYKRRSSSEKK